MANSQDGGSSQHPDLLAAVVLHTLVSEARDGLSVVAIAVACDRDPRSERDIEEILAALGVLLEDGLAERETTLPNNPEAPLEPGMTNTVLEPGTAQQPNALPMPETAAEAAVASEPLYRPTRAAIRAHELSF